MAHPVGAAQHVGVGHPEVVVGHLHRLHALVAQLGDGARHGEAVGARPWLLLHDEAGDAVVGGAGQQHHHLGPHAVGHPHLGAVDDPLVAVGLRPAADVAGVAARVGFRQREGRPKRPVAHAGQEAFPLLIGAVAADHGGGDLVGVEDAGQRHPPPRQLLDDAGVGGGVQAQSAVSGAYGGSEQAKLAHLVEHGLGKLVGVLKVGGVGHHLSIHPGADGADQFVGQFGVHSETTIGHFLPENAPGP